MEGMRPGSASGGSARGEVLASISTGLVRLHSRYYGKGPTKAKTYLVSDTVVCMLRGGFTTVERTLIDEGNVDAVYQIRRSFQQAMEEHFTTVVEAAMGRKVIAYMSQIHQDPDIAVEIFVLEPSEERVVGMPRAGSAGSRGAPARCGPVCSSPAPRGRCRPTRDGQHRADVRRVELELEDLRFERVGSLVITTFVKWPNRHLGLLVEAEDLGLVLGLAGVVLLAVGQCRPRDRRA